MKTMNIRKPVVNHIARTISVTNTFMRAAADPDSEEFTMYMNLAATCPNYKTVIAKQRKARKNPEKPPKLTYAKMGNYIACLRDADKLLTIFEKVKGFAKTQPSPYALVFHWFFESFPDYGCQPDFDADGYPIVEANCISFEAFKQRNEATKQQEQSEIKQNGSNMEQLEA